jgi:DNA-binding response OmpR family regulator
MAHSRKLVLVVDDDRSLRAMLTKALSAKGYEVMEAADGLDASKLLATLRPPPDLLICDVTMPMIDGFSLGRIVKSQPELQAMPIIYLTGQTQPSDIVQGFKLGAQHYVQKPFSVMDLLDKVEKTLKGTP